MPNRGADNSDSVEQSGQAGPLGSAGTPATAPPAPRDDTAFVLRCYGPDTFTAGQPSLSQRNVSSLSFGLPWSVASYAWKTM